MITAGEHFTARVEREHGVHEFTLRDGMTVTGISAPTWEEYAAAIESLPVPTDGYVVSSEFITAPVPLEEIAGQHRQINERLAWVRSMSEHRPWTRFLVGTAQFSEFDPRPTNSVVALFAGKQIGQQHKKGGSWGESEYLDISFDHTDLRAVDIPAHGVIVSAELAEAAAANLYVGRRQRSESSRRRHERLIPPQTRSLIAVSCWGVPPVANMTPEALEIKCATVLAQSVDHIFAYYPNVAEIVMVDRAIPEFGIQPFNFHAQRREV